MEGFSKMYRVRTKLCQDIKDFHEKFNMKYDGNTRILPQKIADARWRHQQEETDELGLALEHEKPVDALDAIVDIVYVALGTAYMMGLDFETAWDRVHEAIMKKVSKATDRSPIDVVKPEGWQEPKLDDLCTQ